MADPDLYCGQRRHRQVAARPLVIAGSHRPVLFQPVDRSLDPVPGGVDFWDKAGRASAATPFALSRRLLIPPLRNHMAELAPPQDPPAAGVAISFIQAHAVRSFPGPPPASRHPDPIQHALQFLAVVPLPFAEVQRQRASASVAGQMQLGRQPAATAAQALVGYGSKRWIPLFLPGRVGPRRRVGGRGPWYCRWRRHSIAPLPLARLVPVTPGAPGSRPRPRPTGGTANGWYSICHSVPEYPATALRYARATACRSPKAGAATAVFRPFASGAVGGEPSAPILDRLNLHVPSWKDLTHLATTIADTP